MAATSVAIGTVIELIHPHQLLAYAPSGRARNEMDETCVAKTESAIAHVGSRPPPVMNVLATLFPPFLKKKLHPNSVVPTRYTPMISKSIQFVMSAQSIQSSCRVLYQNAKLKALAKCLVRCVVSLLLAFDLSDAR